MEALYAFMRHTDDLADDAVRPAVVGAQGSPCRRSKSPNLQVSESAGPSRAKRSRRGVAALQQALERTAALRTALPQLRSSPRRLPPSAFRPPSRPGRRRSPLSAFPTNTCWR